MRLRLLNLLRFLFWLVVLHPWRADIYHHLQQATRHAPQPTWYVYDGQRYIPLNLRTALMLQAHRCIKITSITLLCYTYIILIYNLVLDALVADVLPPQLWLGIGIYFTLTLPMVYAYYQTIHQTQLFNPRKIQITS